MTQHDSTIRDQVVRLMRAGKVTISEAAELAGVDRQLAYYWAKAAKVDVNAARADYLKRLMRKR